MTLLRDRAKDLFAAQNPNILPSDRQARWEARGIREQVIGESPGRDGAMVVVSIRWPPPGARMTLLSIREFIVGPSGERYASKYGMTIDARALPSLAVAIGEAMDVIAQTERSDDERRGGRR